MKKLHQLLFALLLILSVSAGCKKDIVEPTPENPNALRVLPLGDSRVEGLRGEFESYRYELWKSFVSNGWNVDYIGSRKDEGSYPQFQSTTFDTDHEGTGGAVTTDNLSVIKRTTFAAPVEVVLLGIGGNDLTGGKTAAQTISDLRKLIQEIQGKSPNVTIFLEQIAPGLSSFMTPDLQVVFEEYNQQIPDLANSLSTSSSQVIVVDMASNWSDSYMADDVHYNEAGATEVASRYFAAIEANVPKK